MCYNFNRISLMFNKALCATEKHLQCSGFIIIFFPHWFWCSTNVIFRLFILLKGPLFWTLFAVSSWKHLNPNTIHFKLAVSWILSCLMSIFSLIWWDSVSHLGTFFFSKFVKTFCLSSSPELLIASFCNILFCIVPPTYLKFFFTFSIFYYCVFMILRFIVCSSFNFSNDICIRGYFSKHGDSPRCWFLSIIMQGSWCTLYFSLSHVGLFPFMFNVFAVLIPRWLFPAVDR